MLGLIVLRRKDRADGWLRYSDPVKIVKATHLAEVLPKLTLIEDAVNGRGLHAAGFIAYEAAPAFDRTLRTHPPASLPLLWFGLYEHPEAIDALAAPEHTICAIDEWIPSVEWGEYERTINRIKAHIADGETYQVNYTIRLRSRFSGDPWNLFVKLAQAQRANYSAYIDAGQHVICSASPELFFRVCGRDLASMPMKGTAARGRTLAEDEANAHWLFHSEKNRAENVMIVDMIRNDMGRIADIGSVHVPSLFEIERYPTVLQMTSTVVSKTDAALAQIIAALFPCASITGAPKVRTMQIIADLENAPRGVYTGCIGYIAPGRKAQFNVAIRTAVVDRATDMAEYGVGGGIVWDSDAADEYRECQIKARVLTQEPSDFQLLESILWTPEAEYFLLDEHLRRLTGSARYFDIPLDLEQVHHALVAVGPTLERRAHKVRLLVSQAGVVSTQATPLDEVPLRLPMRVGLAQSPIDRRDPFLYHKTTRRQTYEAARAIRPDCDDVLLWNERGEITEATIANVVADIEGELVTPPVECGLLPGTFRGWLLAQGHIHERVITREEIERSQKLYLINSVRKWIDAVMDAGSWRLEIGSHDFQSPTSNF